MGKSFGHSQQRLRRQNLFRRVWICIVLFCLRLWYIAGALGQRVFQNKAVIPLELTICPSLMLCQIFTLYSAHHASRLKTNQKERLSCPFAEVPQLNKIWRLSSCGTLWLCLDTKLVLFFYRSRVILKICGFFSVHFIFTTFAYFFLSCLVYISFLYSSSSTTSSILNPWILWMEWIIVCCRLCNN